MSSSVSLPLSLLPPHSFYVVALLFCVVFWSKMSTGSSRFKSPKEGASFSLRVPPKVPGTRSVASLRGSHSHMNHVVGNGKEWFLRENWELLPKEGDCMLAKEQNPRVYPSKYNKLSKGLIHFQVLFITTPHSHATILLKLSHTCKELHRPSHKIDGGITC